MEYMWKTQPGYTATLGVRGHEVEDSGKFRFLMAWWLYTGKCFVGMPLRRIFWSMISCYNFGKVYIPGNASLSALGGRKGKSCSNICSRCLDSPVLFHRRSVAAVEYEQHQKDPCLHRDGPLWCEKGYPYTIYVFVFKCLYSIQDWYKAMNLMPSLPHMYKRYISYM